MSKESLCKSGNCHSCGSKRAEVKRHYTNRIDEYESSSITHYSILKCTGCGEIYFKSRASNSDDYIEILNQETGKIELQDVEIVKFWPPACNRRPPSWSKEIYNVDIDLAFLFEEVYTALRSNLRVLAATGMRTVFDRASELLHIDTNLAFNDKLKALKDNDYITENDRKALHSLIDAGSAAAHRGWRPEPKSLNQMMDILETFLNRAFFQKEIGTELEKEIPKRRTVPRVP